jgi:hypothetical protein
LHEHYFFSLVLVLGFMGFDTRYPDDSMDDGAIRIIYKIMSKCIHMYISYHISNSIIILNISFLLQSLVI